MKLPEKVCESLHRERNKYPPNLINVCSNAGNIRCPLGDILNIVAWEHRHLGIGLSKKDFGYYVVSPAGKIASDILMLQDGTYWDVLISAGHESTVHCAESDGIITDPNRHWIAPVDPNSPTPPPPSPPPDDLKLRVELLERTVSSLESVVHSTSLSVLEIQNDIRIIKNDVQRIDGFVNTLLHRRYRLEVSKTFGFVTNVRLVIED